MNEGEMRFWSDSEVELLIDDISGAAREAIEKAAGEAAKAAVLSMVEREVAALREAHKWRFEAEAIKKKGIRNIVITGLVCLAGGVVAGMLIK